MANTTNLNLVKLAGSETIRSFPTDFNGNMDKIDAGYGTLNSKISSGSLPNTDLNTLKNTGVYLLDGNKTYTNCPSTYGILEIVVPYNNYLIQRIFLTGTMYWRYCSGGTWYAWKKLTGADV